MLALDLSQNRSKEIARDVFLVGCYTAQRYSDYSIINATNIRTLENGQKVIDLKQQKSGNRVVIPVRPEVFAILKKYNYRLPKTDEQRRRIRYGFNESSFLFWRNYELNSDYLGLIKTI